MTGTPTPSPIPSAIFVNCLELSSSPFEADPPPEFPAFTVAPGYALPPVAVAPEYPLRDDEARVDRLVSDDDLGGDAPFDFCPVMLKYRLWSFCAPLCTGSISKKKTSLARSLNPLFGR